MDSVCDDSSVRPHLVPDRSRSRASNSLLVRPGAQAIWFGMTPLAPQVVAEPGLRSAGAGARRDDGQGRIVC